MLVLAVTSEAGALTPARLVYTRGEGAASCPDESVVRAAVIERMGGDPFSPEAKRTLRLELTGNGSKSFGARIALLDEGKPQGTRELQHRGACTDFVPTIALSIAIALDPESALGAAPKKEELLLPEVHDVALGPPAIAAATPREARPEEPPPEPLHLEGALSPVVWVAAAPSTAIGGVAAIALRYQKISLDLEGRADLPTLRRLASGTISSSIVLASIAPCAHLDGLLLCAVGGIGSFRAESSGVTEPKSDTAFHAVAGLRAGFELPIGSFLWIVARADGLATLTKQTLALDGVPVYTIPGASLGLGIGARVRFF